MNKSTRNNKKQFNILFLILGTALGIYGYYILGILGTGTWFNWIYVAGAVVFYVAGFCWGRILRWKAWLKISLAALIAIMLVIFCVFEAKIISGSKTTVVSDADYVIVLGAKVRTSGVSREFSVRINAALDYWKENPNSVLILTGGQGDDEPMAESKAAEEYIYSCAYYPTILSEAKSTTTLENLKFALELIKADGGNENSKIVIVSSQFHLYRASLYAKTLGYTNTSYLGANGLRFLIPHYYIREFAALVKELLLGAISL